MDRRAYLQGLGSVAVLSKSALAQQGMPIPTLGVLWHAGSAEEEADFIRPLREGFAAIGYVEGKDFRLEHRFPNEEPKRFESYAAELVALKVDVLIAVSVSSALSAQRATSTIPVVFVANPDPVGLKLVKSLSNPGGNITGLSTIGFDLAAKRVELLKLALPGLARLGLLVNPNTPFDAPRLLAEMQPTADKLQISVGLVEAKMAPDLEPAFARMAESKFDAVIVSQNAMYFNEKRRIAELGLKHAMPIMAPADYFAIDGALMSYSANWTDIFRRTAPYVDRILKGAKPADLPVEQPTKFNWVVNLKTAKALTIELPNSVIWQADLVIE